MASTISVVWTHDGLLRIELSAEAAHDLYDRLAHDVCSPLMNILSAMLHDRLDKPRRDDAKGQAESEPADPS